MNDPNGPVRYRGEYHVFFQHDPEKLEWGLMHWSHAKSKDLLHWEELPIALYPDEEGAIFSGSAFVDEKNISGFGSADEPALLLFYTSHNMETGREEQCLAYTTDGVTFQKYAHNPIIPGADHTPARDPQVFANKILGGYSMVLTTEDKAEFYHSTDIIHWEKTGEFRLPEYALKGMIECPCMVFDEKVVLMLSMDVPENEFDKFPKEAVPHKRVMQYFVGDFDGKKFAADEAQKEVLLVDYGEDFYAGTVFANVDEHILIAWLGNFSEGAKHANTKEEGFNGILSMPRMIKLQMTSEGWRLHHEFIEVLKAEEGGSLISKEDGEILTDGCVREEIKEGGFICATSFHSVINAEGIP